MPLSHKRSIYYYKTDVCKDPVDYRSSRPQVFCKKDALRNFAKFTGKHRSSRLQMLFEIGVLKNVAF